MSRFLVTVIIGVISLSSACAYGQSSGKASSNNRANRVFARALQAYHTQDYAQALSDAERAIRLDDTFVAAHILKAEVLYNTGKYLPSAAAYAHALSLDEEVYPQARYYMGVSLLKAGAYEESSHAFAAFLTSHSPESALRPSAEKLLASARFGMWAIQNPVEFEPVNLGASINSSDAEYSPALTADGQTLVFTRRSQRTDPADLMYGPEVENFYVSRYLDQQWTVAVDLGPPINTELNEGAQHISIDGRELYFTACNRPGGFGSCDIYYTQRTGNKWGRPVNLGSIVNSPAWDSQPSVSADGNTLYFASSRRGGLGDMDIWMTERDSLGRWRPPQNLGPVINTSGREMTPFIHPDNKTLYFASDGHPGMGGFDLFYSRKDIQGNWSPPVNMGYPINTLADESGMIVEAAGNQAFFAADRPEGFGGLDIYTFLLHKDARPDPLTYMKGIVYDADTREPLMASFELADLHAGEIRHAASSDEVTGEFLVVVPARINIGLTVSKPGYLFYSKNFFFHDFRDMTDPYVEDIALSPMKAGVSVTLRNVFFDTGSYALKPESQLELDRLLNLLLENPAFHIEMGGHTDNVGTFDYNMRLSENRAGAVARYLTDKGIDAERISYKGYADLQPVDTNDTDEGRANNRRTTFTIIKH